MYGAIFKLVISVLGKEICVSKLLVVVALPSIDEADATRVVLEAEIAFTVVAMSTPMLVRTELRVLLTVATVDTSVSVAVLIKSTVAERLAPMLVYILVNVDEADELAPEIALIVVLIVDTRYAKCLRVSMLSTAELKSSGYCSRLSRGA